MKLRIEVNEELLETEVIIRCSRVDDDILKLQQFALSQSEPKLELHKGQQSFFLPLESILFFETDGEQVYAHTADDAFRVRRRLYELESLLPPSFVRVAKSAIVNTAGIYTINRNLTSASLIRFSNSHKQIYASRHYYHILKQRMNRS